MSNEELNETAVGLAKQLRDAIEAELVELDGAVARSQHEYDDLVKQVRRKNEETNELVRKRQSSSGLLIAVSVDIRDLMRPREGYPQMDDATYEMRMTEIRVAVQSATEDLSKRSVQSE